MNVKNPLLIFLLSTLSIAAGAQESIKEVMPCVDSIVSGIRTTTFYAAMEVKFSEEYIMLQRKQNRHFAKDEELLKTLAQIEPKTARAYEISAHGQTIFALSYTRARATKLEAHYTTWVLMNSQLEIIIDFTTLSPNPKLIYYDKETLKLCFVRIFYGANYYWTRDDSQMDFMIDLSQIEHGVPTRLELRHSRCR